MLRALGASLGQASRQPAHRPPPSDASHADARHVPPSWHQWQRRHWPGRIPSLTARHAAIRGPQHRQKGCVLCHRATVLLQAASHAATPTRLALASLARLQRQPSGLRLSSASLPPPWALACWYSC